VFGKGNNIDLKRKQNVSKIKIYCWWEGVDEKGIENDRNVYFSLIIAFLSMDYSVMINKTSETDSDGLRVTVLRKLIIEKKINEFKIFHW